MSFGRDYMKLTRLQFVMIVFVCGWVAGQVLQAPYKSCLSLALFVSLINAYYYDVHKEIWASMKSTFKMLKK